MPGQPFQPRRLARVLTHLALLLLAGGWLLGPAPAALADAIVVNSTSDTFDPSHACNLRDAITAANNDSPVHGCAAGQPGLDVIHFNWGPICQVTFCQLKLNGPLPQVTETVTIDGVGQFPTISGQNLYGIFDFGVVSATVANLRLVNAKTTSAIHVEGATLTLDHMQFANNQAGFGGGILAENGTLFISHSDFIGNSADFGGALSLAPATAIIASSFFTANTATFAGGAISAIGFFPA